MVLVGYPAGQKGYKVYDLETNKIFTSRDVVFYENQFLFKLHVQKLPNTSRSVIPLSITSDDASTLDTNPLPVELDSQQVSLEQEVGLESPVLNPTITNNSDSPICSTQGTMLSVLLPDIVPEGVVRSQRQSYDEPRSYVQAKKDPKWCDAMAQEIAPLEQNKLGLWRFSHLKNKLFDPNGGARSSTGQMDLLKVIATAKNWELHQLDVHKAFLHGDLHEEVYMIPPPGYLPKGDTRVCRLHKSLYGLKQASRQWFEKFSTSLINYGFTQPRANYSLFTKYSGASFTAVLVYVNELVIAGNDPSQCQALKAYLQGCFHIKDLGGLKYFLELEIARSPSGLFICQRKYTFDILKEAGMLGCKPSTFPMQQQHKLLCDTSPLLSDPDMYRRLVGRLIYLIITRPGISYAVHSLSQCIHQPRESHLFAAMNVLKYLKSSPGQGLFFPASNDFQLIVYCDSDWASCPLTRRSTTSSFIMLGTAPISWKTKKQTTVSRSSAEAENGSMATTTQRASLVTLSSC
ncbi:hypothetical protein SLEP1_g54814 [Rubroshorea leprosula]|uniref:Reverse transcriptase Ty1/copia-type domain-containing protein n=1 Tax=Rubroshorea leprosula TaxID=152421 RepID=A0AAV5MGQ2_9ROSI|nr:hypothetical protein SLEP1_g54814 [Rubroshorea leprosula]